MTEYTSQQYNVTNEQLTEYIGDVAKINFVDLQSVKIESVSSGTYLIEIRLIKVDHKNVEFGVSQRHITHNSRLFDAWRSGMSNNYEDGEDGFSDWDHVVEMFCTFIKKSIY